MHMHRRSEKEQGNFNTLKKDVKIFLQFPVDVPLPHGTGIHTPHLPIMCLSELGFALVLKGRMWYKLKCHFGFA